MGEKENKFDLLAALLVDFKLWMKRFAFSSLDFCFFFLNTFMTNEH